MTESLEVNRSGRMVRLTWHGLAATLILLAVYVASSGIAQRDVCDCGIADFDGFRVEVHEEDGDYHLYTVPYTVPYRWAPSSTKFYAPLEWLCDNTLLSGPLNAYWQGVVDLHRWLYPNRIATPYRTHGGVI